MSAAKSDAVISECGKYRYALSRDWNADLPRLCFVMLNPSTADASVDDPTIRKCRGFAQRLGFGRFSVVNLFAYRATDPADLRREGYPVGDQNNDHIRAAVASADTTVCAWGSNAKGLARAGEVHRLIERMTNPLALKLNAGGIPAHPLMLPYSCQPQPFRSQQP